MVLPFSYHWRNLFVRKTTTLMTLLVVAAVVGVFQWLLGFADAITDSFAVATDPRKLIVLKPGATAESNSAIAIDEFNALYQVADLARDPATDRPLISPEMIVQVSLPRLRDGGKTFANVAVRGVTDEAFLVHRNISLHGDGFSRAEREVIVGQAAARQFGGLEVGDVIHLGYAGDRVYRVVGTFSAGGGPMESEIWGYLPSLMNAYNRTTYSSAGVLIAPEADAKSVIAQIAGPAVELSAMTEGDYWEAQTRLMAVYLGISYVLVVIMSLAAVFSIANTMFSVVAGRLGEIAMLRTIGFSRRHILSGLIYESVVLCTVGGALGSAACTAWLIGVGNTKDMFGANTFTTMAFEIRMSGLIVGGSLGLVVLVGVLGAIVPALRAARMHVVMALRTP